MINIKITPLDLNVAEATEWILNDDSFAINIYIDKTPNQLEGKPLVEIELVMGLGNTEQKAKMEIKKILDQAIHNWQIQKIDVHLRIGILRKGDIEMIVVVAAQNLNDAFNACQYIVGTIKTTVLILKKELFEDGDAWVEPHP